MGKKNEFDFSKAKRVKDLGIDFSKVKFECAKSTVIDRHPEKLEKLLKMIGHPEAFVTDESTIEDFCLTSNRIKKVSAKLGFAINDEDYLVDIVQKMIL